MLLTPNGGTYDETTGTCSFFAGIEFDNSLTHSSNAIVTLKQGSTFDLVYREAKRQFPASHHSSIWTVDVHQLVLNTQRTTIRIGLDRNPTDLVGIISAGAASDTASEPWTPCARLRESFKRFPPAIANGTRNFD